MPAKKHRKEYLSRRKMLALSGATGAAALAGCFGGNGEGNGNSSEDDLLGPTPEEVDNDIPDGYEDNFAEAVPGGAVNPYDGEYIFNNFHSQWNSGDAQEMLFEYVAVFSAADGEFIPRVATEWETDENLLTRVEISEDYGWSDGTELTAADIVTTIKMDAYMLGNDFVDVDSVQTDGDYAFELQPTEDYQDLEEDLWLNQWIETIIHSSDGQYGDFVERFDEAEGDDERESIQEDVINYAPEWNQTRYSGPFAFAEANEQYADMVPNQNHPATDGWEFYIRHGEYEGEEGMRAGEVDWAHNEDATLDDLPDEYDEPPVSFSGQTFAVLFGTEDELIRDNPEVRQAIAYAIDLESITEVTQGATVPVDEYSAGIDMGYIEQFVHEDVLDAMPNYAPQDTDTAEQLLQDVGFERDDDDTWLTPDGETWTLNFPVGNWFEDHSEMVSNDLSEFGIEMDHFVQEMPTWQSEVEPDNAFDLTCHLNYGMARQFHAHADLDEEFNSSVRGLFTERTGMIEEEVEVPPVGEPDSDETITINIPERLDDLATASDEEEMMDAASELGWMHNQLLPAVHGFPWNEHYWVNAGDWNFDLESDDWTTSNRITHYFLQNGLSQE